MKKFPDQKLEQEKERENKRKRERTGEREGEQEKERENRRKRERTREREREQEKERENRRKRDSKRLNKETNTHSVYLDYAILSQWSQQVNNPDQLSVPSQLSGTKQHVFHESGSLSSAAGHLL